MFREAGYWWPDGCRGKVDRYLRHRRDSDKAVKLCRKPRRVAVQAGGFTGLWAMHLSRYFTRVITAEPEESNWACLQRNLAAFKRAGRIEAHNAMLGERAGRGTIQFSRKNAGGHRPRYDGVGKTPVMAIDDLGLENVGLIVLDIEGGELPALMGAVRTISRCRPVLMMEVRGHGEELGYTDKELADWLRRAGYNYRQKVARDRIWTAL